MPMIPAPPVSPQAAAQMGPPGGPNFGPGIGQAMQQQSDPVDTAVSTVEKILLGVQNEAFQKYAKEAIAKLKVGAAMAKQQGPQSGMGEPPKPEMGGGGAPKPMLPPSPGQMPG